MKVPLVAILICLCGPVAAATCAPTAQDPQAQRETHRAALVLTAAQAPERRNPPSAQRQSEPPAPQNQLLLAGVVLMLAIAWRHHGSGSR